VRLKEVKDMEKLGYADPADNEFQQSEKMDTRRPRLSLLHLNKLRKMREVRKLEVEERKELYKKIYQRPVAAM
jgi:hypothetical protein